MGHIRPALQSLLILAMVYAPYRSYIVCLLSSGVEHFPRKEKVVGSNPTGGSIRTSLWIQEIPLQPGGVQCGVFAVLARFLRGSDARSAAARPTSVPEPQRVPSRATAIGSGEASSPVAIKWDNPISKGLRCLAETYM